MRDTCIGHILYESLRKVNIDLCPMDYLNSNTLSEKKPLGNTHRRCWGCFLYRQRTLQRCPLPRQRTLYSEDLGAGNWGEKEGRRIE